MKKLICYLIIIFLSNSSQWDYIPTTLGEFSPGKSGYTDTVPVVATLTSGNYALSWTGKNGSVSNIYMSVYDSKGSILTGPSKVDSDNLLSIFNWTAADDKGGFVIIWNKKDGGQTCCNVNEVLARYYSSSFQAGPIIKVNTITSPINTDYMYPSVAFTGTYYFSCFNPYVSNYGYIIVGQQMSMNNLSLSLVSASNTILGNKVNKTDYGCMIGALGNGTFVITYHSTQAGTYDVYFAILSESTLAFVKPLTAINTNTIGTQANPSIALLSSGGFVIIWWDSNTNGGDINGQLFDINGNLQGPNFKVNTLGKSSIPIVKSLGNDGFVATYKSNSTGSYQIYYQLFSNNGIKIGAERKANTSVATNTVIAMMDVKTNEFVILYVSNTVIYGQFFYKDTSQCKDFTIAIGMDSIPKIKIPFDTTDSNYWVNVSTNPTKGSLVTGFGITLSMNTLYNENDIYYNFNTLVADSFSYTTNYIDASCKVSLTPCYTSCYSCVTIGDTTNHKCSTCDIANKRGGGSFYPLEDIQSMCFLSTDTVSGYYFNIDTWKKCYSLCDKCTGYPTDATKDMLCTSCVSNYYPKVDNTTNCFTGNIDLYYNDGKMYQYCFSTCQTCKLYGSYSDHKCDTCLTGYYPKIDGMTSCYKILDQYYFDGRIFQKCYSTCQTCKALGSDTNHLCDTCVPNYYPKVDNMTSCFTGSLLNYYFDGQVYQKCYSTCQTCTTTPGTDTNHQCNACTNNYYPKYDNMTSCFTGGQSSYYFDGTIYQKCYPSCQTCTIKGVDTNHQCSFCLTNYYPKVDNMTSCFNNAQAQYYFDGKIYQKCYSTCQTCTTIKGTDTNHQCNICIDTYYPKSDNKTSCFTGTLTQYYFDGHMYQNCYSTCQTCTTTPGTATNHQCSVCNQNYFPKVDNQTSCFTGSQVKYYFDGTMYQQCYTNCQTCTTTPYSDTNQQCNTCVASYYPKVDNMTSCFTGTLSQYYFDGKIYQKCYLTCQTCKSLGNDSNHQCDTCLPNYYSKPDNLTSCFTGTQSNYFFDGTTYQKCYPSCQTCNAIGTDKNHSCTACLNAYYPKADNLTSCFTGTQLQYYFDGTKYQKCHPNCKSCTTTPWNDINNQCITCITNYYPKVDNMSSCFTDIQPQYYFDGKIYQKCYTTCQSCTTTPGTDTNHQCAKCIDQYYPKSDNKASCFTGTISKYYFDGTLYQACYSTCETCATNAPGNANNHNCTKCLTNFYPKVDNMTSCFSGSLDQYYFDGSVYQSCYSTCKSCSGKAYSDSDNQCTKCISNYFPKADNLTSCFTGQLNYYYLNINQYQKCYSTCLTCTAAGYDSNHQCSKCGSGYYPKIDNMTSCYNGVQDMYFFDGQIYQKCFPSCKTCKVLGTDSNHSCLNCLSNYYNKVDNTSSCFTGNQNYYYFDGSIYQKCHANCLTCTTMPYTQDNNQCTTCITGYYPMVGNTSNCYTGSIQHYYLDDKTKTYQKCFSSCLSCSNIGNYLNHQCITCIASYYPKADNLSSCFTGDVMQYYFDGSLYQQCFSTCNSCTTTPGTSSNHQCLTCLADFYPREDNTTSCSNGPIDYYYLDNAKIYKKCHPLCKTCTTLGTDSDNQCTTCVKDYYPKEDSKTNCFTGSFDYYYFNGNEYRKCYKSCQTCTGGGTEENNQCSKCLDGYFPLFNNVFNCMTGKVDQYFLDGAIYRSCYPTCQECTTSGTDADNKCDICKYAYRIIKGTNNCEATGEPLPGYYFVENPRGYKPCNPTCLYCTDSGTDKVQNCTECNKNYYPLKNKPGQCYPSNKDIPNYYFDKEISQYIQCYESCLYCSYEGTYIMHNCLQCTKDYYHLFDDPTKCFKKTEIVQYYYYDYMLEVFKNCFKSCSECYTSGDEDNHHCITCQESYYPLVDSNTFCHKADEVVRGYYFDQESKVFRRCYHKCSLCNGPGDVRNPNCTECFDLKTDCSPCNDLVYYDSCLIKCPDKTVYDSANKECSDCKVEQILFENSCLDHCLEGWLKEADSCISCQSKNKYYLNNTCVDSCPYELTSDSIHVCKGSQINTKSKYLNLMKILNVKLILVIMGVNVQLSLA
jgi:hypothetical protein